MRAQQQAQGRRRGPTAPATPRQARHGGDAPALAGDTEAAAPHAAGAGAEVEAGTHTSPTEERADVYARVTAAIVASIEAGLARGADWRMPWHRRRGSVAPSLPANVASRAGYRGVNTLALWAAAEARGYDAGLWGTYRQWSALGGQVRRGETATPVVFWQFPQAGHGAEGGEGGSSDGGGEDADHSRRGPWARCYSVFNLAQVDGASLPADGAPALPEDARIAAAEAFFARLPGLDLRHGGTAAFYSPGSDHVQLPRFADFRNAEGYYATLAHEAGHWTGHPTRLARDLSGRFGSAAYAAEELVAELAAAFTCAGLGLATEPRADHAQYVAHWLDVLRADQRAIFSAASQAQRAADWMMQAGGEVGPGAAAAKAVS